MFSPSKISLTIYGIKSNCLYLLNVFNLTQPSSKQVIRFDLKNKIVFYLIIFYIPCFQRSENFFFGILKSTIKFWFGLERKKEEENISAENIARMICYYQLHNKRLFLVTNKHYRSMAYYLSCIFLI